MNPDKQTEADVVRILLNGGIAVLRTDTIYGIVARADDKQAVARLYAARHRDERKSCIVLLDAASSAYGHTDELAHDLAEQAEEPTSFLIPAETAPPWLLRENNLLAYRVPNVAWLCRVLAQTGPLIAPSANTEGKMPARTIDEARQYFGDAADIYVDGGEVPADTKPSRLVRIRDDGRIEQLR